MDTWKSRMNFDPHPSGCFRALLKAVHHGDPPAQPQGQRAHAADAIAQRARGEEVLERSLFLR